MRLQLDTLSPQALDSSRTESTGKSGTGRPLQSGSSGSDTIQVSGASGILNLMAVEREARIRNLTGLVRSNSYDVGGAAIAKSIVDQSGIW